MTRDEFRDNVVIEIEKRKVLPEKKEFIYALSNSSVKLYLKPNRVKLGEIHLSVGNSIFSIVDFLSKYKNQGNGAKLLDEVIDLAKVVNAKGIKGSLSPYDDTIKLERFYAKFGFNVSFSNDGWGMIDLQLNK